MTITGTNATGWSELMKGRLIASSFNMYDAALLGYTIAILFIVFQVLLYLKTRNPLICASTGLMFGILYGVSVFMQANSVSIIVVILVFELAGIFYSLTR